MIPRPSSTSQTWRSLQHFYKNRGALISMLFILLVALIAILAPLLAPHNPTQLFTDTLRLPPAWNPLGNANFLLGSDDLGRDTLSRLIHGARISLGIGFTVVTISGLVGSIMGLLAGYFGGTIDRVISGAIDMLMALPSVLLAIVIISVLGPGVTNAVIAVSFVALPGFTRIMRSAGIEEMGKEYVVAAQAIGASHLRIMFKEILPNSLSPMIVQASLGFSDAILNSAALGFLGLGVQAPAPEWGVMLSDARPFIESSPWMVTLPGLSILLVVLAFNLMGNGLRDSLDPKLRQR
ncbi:MAG: ABC transporter permease subunit [Bdellovibrionales bacterium]|nr:ABC transporter permease subunit [Bdellovibrionales bacterium]